MIAKPILNSLLKKVDSRYSLISVVAKRARELNNGSKELTPRVEGNGNNVTEAANEIEADKVTYEKSTVTEE